MTKEEVIILVEFIESIYKLSITDEISCCCAVCHETQS